MSPAAALENRDTDSAAMWNPQGAPQNYNDFYISVDADFPTSVEAVLWANNGDTVHDPTQLLVFLSDDAVSWTHVATLDLSAIVGSKDKTVLAMPAARAARYWKLNPRGIQFQPQPRVIGLCDTPDCTATTAAWASKETPTEEFPENGFAAKWIGSVEIKTAGTYMFYLTSRDGGRLYIDNKKVVDSYSSNGGWRKSSPSTYLWPGYHSLVADMYKAPQSPATASALLEYKGPDTSQEVVTVKGVHDPELEGEEPASEEAAETAMREAKLRAKDEAVLAAARNKGAELAASLARLRAQESKLRQKEALHGPESRHLSPPLPLGRGQPRTSSDVKDVKGQLGHVSSPAPRVAEEATVIRGRSATGDAQVRRDNIVRQRVRERMQWPSYRSNGDTYQLRGAFRNAEDSRRSSVLDTERRWGWVKRGLEGYGRRQDGYYRAEEDDGEGTGGSRRQVAVGDGAWGARNGPRRLR